MARSSPRRTASTTATAAGIGSRKVPAKKRKPSPLSKQEGGAKAKKVDRKRDKKRCSADGCEKYAQNGTGVCIAHGAKAKRCNSEGCTNQARVGGVCIKHGATHPRCTAEGCTNQAKTRGVCVRHGAKYTRKQCSAEGCTNNAVKGGVCKRHGAKAKVCSTEGCTSVAQNGGVCIRHGAQVKQCSAEGCTNNAVKGGVCKRHGARVKQCSKEGCENQAIRKGVCWSHGAKPKLTLCSSEGCNYPARKQDGLCFLHWEKQKYRNAQAAAEQTAVAVSALPPEPLPTCAICLDPYNISDMVTCGIESACSYTVCHNCLIRRFSKPWKMVSGQWIYYDAAQCPACRQEDAFTLNERDQVIVNREMEEMYCYEVASVATSHEQDDSESEYEPPSDEEEDD